MAKNSLKNKLKKLSERMAIVQAETTDGENIIIIREKDFRRRLSKEELELFIPWVRTALIEKYECDFTDFSDITKKKQPVKITRLMNKYKKVDKLLSEISKQKRGDI